jgi:hypothetical protein
MVYKKFNQQDLLQNRIIVNPKVKFFITNGAVYILTQNVTAEEARAE